jgi:predicted transporter
MDRTLFVHIVTTLCVALVVMGILYGVALGWSATTGIHSLWVATLVVFASFLIGCLVTAALQDAHGRPQDAPTAFQMGFRTALMVAVLACAPLILAGIVNAWPFLAWWALQSAAQVALQLRFFRKQDPYEAGGDSGTRADRTAP